MASPLRLAAMEKGKRKSPIFNEEEKKQWRKTCNVWEQPNWHFPGPFPPGRCPQPAPPPGLFLTVPANISYSSFSNVLTQVSCGFFLSSCDRFNTACCHFPPGISRLPSWLSDGMHFSRIMDTWRPSPWTWGRAAVLSQMPLPEWTLAKYTSFVQITGFFFRVLVMRFCVLWLLPACRP